MAPPSQIPSLNFSWRDFEYGRPPLCFAACVIMCCRYWVNQDPRLELPSTFEEFADKLGNTYYSLSGLSIERLRQVFKKQEIDELDGERINIGIDMELRTPKDIEALYPFLMTFPQIPLIISFDKGYTEKNVISEPHAVILHSIDYERELISVIDPVKKRLKEPYDYPFKRFMLGWEKSDNLIFIAAPLGRLNLINGREIKVIRQMPLTRFK